MATIATVGTGATAADEERVGSGRSPHRVTTVTARTTATDVAASATGTTGPSATAVTVVEELQDGGATVAAGATIATELVDRPAENPAGTGGGPGAAITVDTTGPTRPDVTGVTAGPASTTVAGN